jgi:LPS sulfotransferase NodH
MNKANVLAKSFVFLISHERSGSHYLSDLLHSTGKVTSLDEVCNFNAVDPEKSRTSFFRFRREAAESDPDIVLRPSVSSMTRLLDGYLDYLSQIARGPTKTILDIKYGHVHNFEVGWWPTERRPFLCWWLSERNIPVVHLNRCDSVAASVSDFVAKKRGVWHRKGNGKDKRIRAINVPASTLAQEAVLLEREKDNFFNWLSECNCLTVEYEQLVGNEVSRRETMIRLCEFLQVPAPAIFMSNYLKVTPPVAEVVRNYEELGRAIQLFGQGRLHGTYRGDDSEQAKADR